MHTRKKTVKEPRGTSDFLVTSTLKKHRKFILVLWTLTSTFRVTISINFRKKHQRNPWMHSPLSPWVTNRSAWPNSNRTALRQLLESGRVSREVFPTVSHNQWATVSLLRSWSQQQTSTGPTNGPHRDNKLSSNPHQHQRFKGCEKNIQSMWNKKKTSKKPSPINWWFSISAFSWRPPSKFAVTIPPDFMSEKKSQINNKMLVALTKNSESA